MAESRHVPRIIRFCGAACIAGAIHATSVSAQPAAWPTRPVRVVVPFTAGSPVEIPARPVAQRLSETLGQQFLIDNRTGASGTIGTEVVVKAPRDGYTVLWTNCSHSSNPSHLKNLPYDSLADLAPVTMSNRTYGNLLVVHPTVPARSVKEFIDLAKKMPGRLHYASAGVGSPPHTTGALFAAMTDIRLEHVAYKGTSVAFTDVIGGYVEVMFSSPPFTLPYIQSGRVRALGLGGPRRTPILPDVPTFDETGLKGFDMTCYHGIWFPAGTPAEIVRRMNAEVVKAIALPEIHKHYETNGLIPVGSSPGEFATFLRNEMARQAEIARKIGITPR
ncbi:MAG: tripartite tricarboxylate transporter substrate binding protein [Burkholderiales bacterium]|nr:tripartite tricarboxylate transporter substrate binding protein [Burkholderiales bacterium]